MQELNWSVDSGKWSSGALAAQNYQVAPYSNIAGFTSDESIDNLSVKIYVQLVNNTIQEYIFNGEYGITFEFLSRLKTNNVLKGQTNAWGEGNPLGTALAGTKIAADCWSNSNIKYGTRPKTLTRR